MTEVALALTAIAVFPLVGCAGGNSLDSPHVGKVSPFVGERECVQSSDRICYSSSTARIEFHATGKGVLNQYDVQWMTDGDQLTILFLDAFGPGKNHSITAIFEFSDDGVLVIEWTDRAGGTDQWKKRN
jgi:hypothetical protein